MHYKVKCSQGQIAIVDTKPTVDEHYPALVLIHGHCTNKLFFREQLTSPLFSSYRLIALDLPGYGDSDVPNDPERVYCFPGFAEVVAQVISQFRLKNFVIMGWSLGGHVALELTSKLSNIKGLLITGTPPIEISAKGLSKGFRVSNPKILECFGKGNLTDEEAELFATISGYDYTKEKKFIVDAIYQTSEGAKTLYPQSILKCIGQNELLIVREWPNPIAVIAGADDKGINNDYIINEVKFRNLWRSQIHLIPQGGHAVFLDQPEKFNLLLNDFLNDIFYTNL